MQRSAPNNMPDLLPLTGSAIIDYQDHISRYPDTDPVILAYLARHINGLMCAEIERVVTRLVCERLEAKYNDNEISNFFLNFLDSRRISSIKNVRVDQVRTTLTAFGRSYREKFDDLMNKFVTPEDVGNLSVAVKKRNDDAHSIPPTVSFEEVQETYRVATSLVDAVRQTLET